MIYIFVCNVSCIKSDFFKLKSLSKAEKFILIASNYCLRNLSTKNQSCFEAIHPISRNFHNVDYEQLKQIIEFYVKQYGAENVRLMSNEGSTQIGCAKIREFYGIPVRPLEIENTVSVFSNQTDKLKLNLENHFEIMEELFNAMPYVFWKDRDGRYRGCNSNHAKAFHFNSVSDFIGKTVFEILSDLESARKVEETDNAIMNNGRTVVLEETLVTPEGLKTYLSQKQPLYDESGVVVGMLGFSVDVTEIKEKEHFAKKQSDKLVQEKHQLEVENEKQKVLLEQEEKFRKLAYQIVHDVQSPLTTLSTIANSSVGLPENQRIDLRRAVSAIRDTTRHLLQQYQKKESDNNGIEEREAVLVSQLLSEMLTAKRYQYKSLPIQFDAHVNHDTQFAFIRVQKNHFERMLSNLINNAVDAFDENPGEIKIDLMMDEEWVRIHIQDSGKGMPPEVVHKIMSKVSFTTGKQSGHGIGLGQVWETLERNHGELDIDSTSGKGTTMTLTFPRTKVPNWCADEIVLEEKDTVVVLDDDPSIHGAWDLRFDSIAKQNHHITIRHFRQSSEALGFIHRHSAEDKDHIFLLSDYELIEQDKNGLEVIAATGLKRALLVTSHYADRDVQNKASDMKIRILPKSLAPEVSITVLEKTADMADADTIILDDNESFARSVAAFIFKKSKVDQYHRPEELLRHIHRYTLDTRIFLDNNYDNSYLKGTDIAEKLYEQGYKRLYLVSGEVFKPGEIADYLTVISKENIEKMKE